MNTLTNEHILQFETKLQELVKKLYDIKAERNLEQHNYFNPYYQELCDDDR
jgi:hypothetical protein